ncbi:MAG: (2Fe-2S)-binding protein [Pseudomonadota bacterium]
MIVCSCNVVTKQEIADVVRDFLREDEWQLITIGMVYHAMAVRGKCCGCFPNAIDIIIDVSEQWHRSHARDEATIIPFVTRIREEHERCETVRNLAKMRQNKKIAA